MAVIYCFTSTGNSLYVAKKIAKEINADIRRVSLSETSTDDDVVGIVYPCFFLSAPPIVMEFAGKLKIQNPDAYVFAIETYGGQAPGSESLLSKYIKGNGISYANKVKMVENYLPRYNVNDTAEVHEKSEKKIETMISDIKSRKIRAGGWYSPVNSIINKFYPGRDPACDKKFKVSDECTSCGLCAKICPVSNIRITEGKPAFSHRCQHCIACMHICPASAISYGKSAGKGRYVHPDIGAKTLLEFWSRYE